MLVGREAWSVQSTGEKLAVALVLNRADCLTSMGYTLAETIDRTKTGWLARVLEVANELVAGISN